MKRSSLHLAKLAALLLCFAARAEAQVMELSMPKDVKRIVINEYYTTYKYYDGMLAVQNRETGKWGFINEQGDLVHDFVWYANENMRNPHFGGDACTVTRIVDKQEQWYVIDKAGKSYRVPGVIHMSNYCTGYAQAVKLVNGKRKIVYLNSKGQEVFPNLSRMAGVMEQAVEPFPFSEGLMRYYDRDKRKFGYVDTSGKIVIPTVFDDARDFSEGVAAVRASTTSGYRWGFIDKTGAWVIPAKFSKEPYPFVEGLSSVQKANDKCVFFDKSGTVVSDEYADVRQFHNGYAFVQLPGRQFASVVDSTFKIVMSEVKDVKLYAYQRLEKFLDFKHDCCEFGSAANPGMLYAYNGQSLFQLSSYTYYSIDNRTEYLMHCKVRENTKHYDGFIDYEGKFVFLFVKDEF